MRTAWDAVLSVARHVHVLMGEEWEVRTDDEAGLLRPPFVHVRRVGPVLSTTSVYFTEHTMPLSLAAYAGDGATVLEGQIAAYEVEEKLTKAFQVSGAVTPFDAPVGVGVTIVPDVGHLTPGRYSYQVTGRPWRGEGDASEATMVTIGSGEGVQVDWDFLPGARSYSVYRNGFLAALTLEPTWTDVGVQTNSRHAVPEEQTGVLGAPRRIPLYDYDGLSQVQSASDLENRGTVADYLRIVDFTTTQLPEPENSHMVAVVANIRVSWRRSGVVLSGSQTVTDVRTELSTS